MRLLFLAALLLALPAAAAPRVVATIAPVHSLTAAVMQGVGEPGLLVPADASPHHFALKPSAAGALAEADVVVRVGPMLETALERPLSTLGADALLLTLAETPGQEPIALDGTEAHADGDTHEEAPIDPHFWLDPRIGALWAARIADALAEADPANAARYRQNAKALADRLSALEAELQRDLAPLRDRGFVLLHDSLRYFGRRFGLHPAAVVAGADAAAPGARRVAEVLTTLRGLDDPCLFDEPQESRALIERLAAESGARIGTLDPIGVDLEPGAELYPALLRQLADALSGCLGPQG